MTKNRIEAFSDGVFAIAITLLILDLRLPEGPYEELAQGLVALWPHIMAYALTFVVIGVYWVSHHRASTLMVKVDHRALWLNILLLMFVGFMPFPASMLGEYPFETLPVLFYGLNLLGANATGFVTILYVYRNPALRAPGFTRPVFVRLCWVYGLVNGAYLVALGLAFFLPWVSTAVFVVVMLGVIGNFLWGPADAIVSEEAA